MLSVGTFNALKAESKAVCEEAFNQGTTWFSISYAGASTPNPVPEGFTGVPVLYFASYYKFTQALSNLPSWTQAVQYDSEDWSDTPDIEQGAWLVNTPPGKPPVSYAQSFCQAAHARGLKVVLSPANNLCNNVPNPAYDGQKPYPLNAGEQDYQAFVRHDLASAAQWLQPGDVFEFQAQVLETLPGNAYRYYTSEVAGQVQPGPPQPNLTMLAGLGRTAAEWDGASVAQLTAVSLCGEL